MTVSFDDRTLAHLQSAINIKLQHQEGFHFTWSDEPHAVGSGRNAIWIHPGIPLSFKFSTAHPPHLNRSWLEALLRTANTTTGLELVPEPPHPTTG
ncbi:ATP-dependent DNA ligase [Cryobacterium cheniae]|nr:ATP-dependent DNA ligase [Cryobacterium cheniae]